MVKVKGLDGREYQWKLTSEPRENASQYHQRAKELLSQSFPFDPILEEIYLPGAGRLYADFFLPRQRMIVEVHGEQHYSFSLHLHRDKSGFLRSKIRDNKKKEWCEINSITLIELPYNRESEWPQIIFGKNSDESKNT